MVTTTTRSPKTSLNLAESSVESHLQHVQQRIRFLDLFHGLILLASGTISWFLILLLLDRSIHFSPGIRQLFFCVFTIGWLIATWFLILRPWLMSINPYYAAFRLEKKLAGSKNSLINWLDLHNQPLPPAIRGSISNRALADLKNADLETIIPSNRLFPSLSILGVLSFLTLILMGILGPVSFFALLGRVVFPVTSSAVLPTETQIAILKPEGGNGVIPQGTALTILVKVEGVIPQSRDKNSLRVHWRGQGNPTYQERMLQPQESPREWGCVLSAEEVGEGIIYKVSGGDAETPEYQITVRANPAITAFQANYHFQASIGKADEVKKDRKIEALRGTEVTLFVHVNRTLKSCQMLLDGSKSKTIISGTINPEDPTIFRIRMLLEESGLYRLSFQTTEDEIYTDKIFYPLVSLVDQPPVVEINRPNKDIELPANGLLVVEGKASDDYGVKSLTLQLKASGGPVFQGKEYRADRGGLRLPIGSFPRLVEYRDELDFSGPIQTTDGKAYILQPGMELEYWLEAVDNCENPGPNRSQSKHYKVNLTPPQDGNKQKAELENVRNEREKHRAKEENQRQQEEKDRQEKARQQREQENQEQGHSKPGDGKGNNGNNPSPNGGELDSQSEKQTREQAEKLAQEEAKQKEGSGSEGNGNSKENQQPGQAKEGGNPQKGQEGRGDNQNPQPPDQIQSNSPGSNKPNEPKGESGSGGKENPGQNKEGADNGQSQQPGAGKEPGKDEKSKPQGQEKTGQNGNQPGPNQPSEAKDDGQSKSGGNNSPDPSGKTNPSDQPNKSGSGKEDPAKNKASEHGTKKPGDAPKAGQHPSETKNNGQPDKGESPGNPGQQKPGPGSSGDKSQDAPDKSQTNQEGNSAGGSPGTGNKKPREGQPNQPGNPPNEGNPKGDGRDPAKTDRKDLERINQKLQNPDEKVRAEGMKELDKIKEQTQDKEIRDLANELANQQKTANNKPMDPSQKNDPGQPGESSKPEPNPGSPSGQEKGAKNEPGVAREGTNPSKPVDQKTPEEKPGEGKPGDRNKAGQAPGLAKEEGPQGRDEKSKGKPQGVPRGGGDINMNRPPQATVQETPANNDKGQPAQQKATEAQLEHFKKLLDKKMLERLQMTEQARDQFLKNYEKLVQRDKTLAGTIDPQGATSRLPGKLPTSGSNVSQNPNLPPIVDVGAGNSSKAPPGYQNDHAEFLKKLAELSKSKK